MQQEPSTEFVVRRKKSSAFCQPKMDPEQTKPEKGWEGSKHWWLDRSSSLILQ